MGVVAEQARGFLGNPFWVLGVSREGLRGLNPEQARELAKVFYDFHAARVHPDVGGEESGDLGAWKRVNRAWEKLQDPEALATALRTYRPMTPEAEASHAERLALRMNGELDRARRAVRDYLETRDPIWRMGPCTIRIVDLERAFSAHRGAEAEVLSAAMEGRGDVVGLYTRTLALAPDGSIEDERGRRSVRGVLRLEQNVDDPADLLVRFRRAGLKLPDLSHLLPPAGGAAMLDKAAPPPPPFNLHHIHIEQFAELAPYVIAEPKASDHNNLSLLLSVDKGAQPIFHLDGVITRFERESR